MSAEHPRLSERLFPVVCSWCGKVVGFSEVEHSHGICQKCSGKLLAKMLTERAS